MSPLLKLEAIATDPPVEIIQIDTGSLSIGRGTENHIVIDSEAVSRRHGCLMAVEQHWVFKDFESTNGTWINGVRLTPGQMKLIREGDVLQLADFPIRFSSVDRSVHPQISGPNTSLLVFYKDHFEAEFPMESSSSFSIGGPAGDFFLEGVPNDKPQLEIIYDGSRLELACSSSVVPVIVNHLASRGVAALTDRDEINVGAYTLIVNDLKSAAPTEPFANRAGAGSSPVADTSAKAYDRPNLPDHLRQTTPADQAGGWESEASRRLQISGKRFVFGTDPEEDETTSTLGVSARSYGGGSVGFEMNASQRFAQAISAAEKRQSSALSEGILVVIGVVVFCLIVGLLAYFYHIMS